MRKEPEFTLRGAYARNTLSGLHLGIPVFRSNASNYSYVAETDLNFQIVRFVKHGSLDLDFTPSSVETTFSIGDFSPICFVDGSTQFETMTIQYLFENFEEVVQVSKSALARVQILKLVGAHTSLTISAFEELAKQLRLEGAARRDYVAEHLQEMRSRSGIWSRLDEQPPPEERSERYINWSSEKMVVWLLNHAETDNPLWYEIWNYFDDHRMPDNEVFEAGFGYIDFWSRNSDLKLPVGKIIERLLIRRIQGENPWYNPVFDGFASGRFYQIESDTPPWRRILFMNFLIPILRSRPMNQEFQRFLRMFISAISDVLSQGGGRYGFGVLTPEELQMFVSVLFEAADEHLIDAWLHGEPLQKFYAKNRRALSIKDRRRMAQLLRSLGYNPASAARRSVQAVAVREELWD